MKSIIRSIPVRVTIQNVVASARLKHDIDLKAIVRAFPNVKYRPEVFPGLPFKLKNPRSCILLFDSGSMVCTGTKGEKEARRAVLDVVRELRDAGIAIRGEPEFTIQNIVASVDLDDATIDVEKLVYAAHRLGIRVMYEPEQFPGAIYHMEDPKVVFLIFSTGKLVCVGAKREEEVYRAVEKLVTILDENGLIVKGSR